MNHGFHLTTSDAEEFQERISPLAGACRVRPAKGAKFGISVCAARLDKLSLFVVKAQSLKVHTPAPHAFFGLNLPLGKPFSAAEPSRRMRFDDDVHLLLPDRHMNLEARSEMRVLAVKLDCGRILDHAFKLSGSRKPLESAAKNRLPLATSVSGELVRGIARLWSDLQRQDVSLASAISRAERVDALLTFFVLALEGEEDARCRPGEQAGKYSITRAEEYLRARLTSPVSRADLAAITRVSIRTLSRGFTKRWGTGPMGFLRHQRMEAAYRELLGAESGATTVTEVACRYGFTHLGKFAVEYKHAFHESPSETLLH